MARVLLVDDEIHILTVLHMLFKSRGDEVTTARGGQEALTILEKQEFDLMVSDIRMKPINGLEVLRVARDRYPKMPAIMVTAYDAAEANREALALGAAAYLTKPFDNEELLGIAEKAIRESKEVE
ncbi:MAG: response regulator [Verrucomicrobia bacterium]|nr:response regulator [Verrucomicrobiota bacterium]MDA1086403.1 response regulator [Verrucomicrobiota bacterium]